jgi:hypothetical protein
MNARMMLALVAMAPCFMHPVRADDNFLPPINRAVIESISQMPSGGGYSPSVAANRALGQAVGTGDGKLSVNPSHATPSYCSGATYLVFLKTLSALQSRSQLNLTPGAIAALKPAGQPDGTGIWGRWNANGPGTARLFYELGLGPNFTDLRKALPGDFLKIFWSNAIGSTEHGHSVVFLGYDSKSDSLSFWSSNIPGGYGKKSVPLRKIHRMLFSRLEHPENINHPPSPNTDRFLSSLEHHPSGITEMERQCGLGNESRR